MVRIYQTNKRRICRAERRVDQWIGYSNQLSVVSGPALVVNMGCGYEVEVTFKDLAHLVRKADEYAKKEGMPKELADWRSSE